MFDWINNLRLIPLTIIAAVGATAGVVATIGGGGGPCPDGWDYHATEADHAVVFACEQDSTLVILDPDTKEFERAIVNGEWVTEPNGVPGWLD